MVTKVTGRLRRLMIGSKKIVKSVKIKPPTKSVCKPPWMVTPPKRSDKTKSAKALKSVLRSKPFISSFMLAEASNACQ